jgi:type I restriction enzyme S subunit
VSRFDDLVTQLCPDGVELRPLGDLLDYEQPGKYLVESTAYNNGYTTPVLTAGQTFVLGYTDEKDGIYPASPARPVVIFDDFTTAFKWVDFPFKAKSSAMKMLTSKHAGFVSLRYAYYAMQTIKYTPQDHARQWIGKYSHFEIPVPPIEVQRKIVHVLNLFTELEAKLEAELEARQLQYRHYRDWLFAFCNAAEVRWTPLGELGAFIRGRRFTKADVTDDGIPAIHYGEIYTHYGVATNSTVSHVRYDLADQLRYGQPGDVIFAAVGETVEDVAKAVAWLGNEQVAIHDDTFLFRGTLNPKFVSYFAQTSDFHAQKNKYVARAKVKRLSGESLAKIMIPVPSHEKQDEIVAVLDKFDAFLNDPSIGLPAEINARRKQYEHYRDRLLTFQELAA